MPVKYWSFKPFLLKGSVKGDQGEIVYGSQSYIYNYLYGGPADDTIVGCGMHYTLMEGKGGNDLLKAGPCGVDMYGGIGQDTLEGGVGNDTLHGDEGNDYLVGGRGADSIYDVSGNNQIWGGDGADHIFVRDGVQKVYGGNDNDTIIAQNIQQNTDLRGEYGSDRIEVDGNGFRVYGGPGDDTIVATSDSSSYVDGEDGNDLIQMYGANLIAAGGLGADNIDLENSIKSNVVYYRRSESQPGASDTIRNLRGDNHVSLIGLGLHWAQNGNDHSDGAFHIENNWWSSRAYAYNADGKVDFEITFKSSDNLTSSFFVLRY